MHPKVGNPGPRPSGWRRLMPVLTRAASVPGCGCSNLRRHPVLLLPPHLWGGSPNLSATLCFRGAGYKFLAI